MKKKHIILSLLILVILSNITPFAYFFGEDYVFSNYNGEFYVSDLGGKGRSFAGIRNGFANYVRKHPEQKDKRLYRVFTLKPWRFWEWLEWIVELEKFALSYISEKQILENRKEEGLPEKY